MEKEQSWDQLPNNLQDILNEAKHYQDLSGTDDHANDINYNMFTAEHSLIDPVFCSDPLFTDEVPDTDENMALNLNLLIQKFKDSHPTNNDTFDDIPDATESLLSHEIDLGRSAKFRGKFRMAPENSMMSTTSLKTSSSMIQKLASKLETVAVEDLGDDLDDEIILETYNELCADEK